MEKEIQDERIIQENQRLNSIGFAILYFGLLLDLIYRQFILQEHISGHWDLFLLFIGVSFFLAFKRVGAGLLTYKFNWKRTLLSSGFAAVLVSIFNFWWFDNKSLIDIFVGGVSFFIGFYGLSLLMQYFSSKKNDDMSKED